VKSFKKDKYDKNISFLTEEEAIREFFYEKVQIKLS
jgi:hypothetical protein